MLTRILAQPLCRWTLIAATCVVMFGIHLDASSLWDPDEGRHAEIAREMLVTGNWLTPTLELRPYHDKPILFYWLAAGAMRLFGAREWVVRLPSVVAACAGVAATAWWASRYLGPLTGTMAGLILASAGMYVVLARFVVLDMLLTGWMSIAFLYGSAWCIEGRVRRWPLWPFYVSIALAMLTKGPVAPVLAVLTFWPFLRRRNLPIGMMRPLAGALIILVIAGSWYLTAAWVAPAYMTEFVIGHNIERFATGSVGHRMNPFAYLYLLPLAFLPWSLYLPALAIRARATEKLRMEPALEFCAIWIVVVVLFFSLSAAKLATYLLPIFPPLAILIAAGLAPIMQRLPLTRAEEAAHRWAFYVLAAVVLIAPVAAFFFLQRFVPDSTVTAAWLVIGIPVVVVGLLATHARRYDCVLAAVFVLTVTSLTTFYARIMPVLNEVYSLKTPAALLSQSSNREVRVVALQTSVNSLSFYRGQPVETASDCLEAAGLLAQETPILIVTRRQLEEPLQRFLEKPAFVWWENGKRRAIIGNHPPPSSDGWHVRQLQPRAPIQHARSYEK